MKDKSRMEHVEMWARHCKADMKKCQEDTTPFINAQIQMANDFYKRLEKTKGGKEKIKKLKGLY